MEENNNKTQNQAIVIVGLIVLIIGLFIGIKLVFAGLDSAIPDLKHMGAAYEQQEQSGTSADGSAAISGEEEGPAFCIHCGKEMREDFRWGQFCPYCGKKVE